MIADLMNSDITLLALIAAVMIIGCIVTEAVNR